MIYGIPIGSIVVPLGVQGFRFVSSFCKLMEVECSEQRKCSMDFVALFDTATTVAETKIHGEKRAKLSAMVKAETLEKADGLVLGCRNDRLLEQAK